MAKKKFFDSSCFVDEFELEIESSVKRNLDRITDEKSIKKSHAKIAEILKAQKQDDNKYLNIEIYRNLISNLKKEKQIKTQKMQEQSKQKGNVVMPNLD